MWVVTDQIAKSSYTTVYSEKNGYEYFKTLFTNFYGFRPHNSGSGAPLNRINLPDKMANRDVTLLEI